MGLIDIHLVLGLIGRLLHLVRHTETEILTFSSVDAPEVAILATSYAVSDEISASEHCCNNFLVGIFLAIIYARL